MTPIAQNIRVIRAVIGKKWLKNVAADVLDHVVQLIIKVFDKLGGRRLVHAVVTGRHTTA